MNAWKAEDYQTMYSLLTPASQDALALEKFIQRYNDAAVNMTLQKLDYEILSKLTNPSSAQVAYQVTFHTQMLGDLTREMTMNLSLEKGAWRVQWDDGLILPELHGGNTLAMDLKSPTRGNIYDRNGNAVAAASDIFALGVDQRRNRPGPGEPPAERAFEPDRQTGRVDQSAVRPRIDLPGHLRPGRRSTPRPGAGTLRCAFRPEEVCA